MTHTLTKEEIHNLLLLATDDAFKQCQKYEAEGKISGFEPPLSSVKKYWYYGDCGKEWAIHMEDLLIANPLPAWDTSRWKKDAKKGQWTLEIGYFKAVVNHYSAEDIGKEEEDIYSWGYDILYNDEPILPDIEGNICKEAAFAGVRRCIYSLSEELKKMGDKA